MIPHAEAQALKRVRIVARLLLLWAFFIFLRLAQFQVLSHDELAREAQQQQEKLVEVQARRGGIFDRSGQPLALSLPVESVCVNPLRIPDQSLAAGILAGVLNLNQSELLGKILLSVQNHRGFMWVKRRVTPEEAERLRSFGFDWIEFRKESQRFYPKGSLAAQVIGSVGFDENGNGGLELSMNDELQGHAGEVRMISDVNHRGFAEQVDDQAEAGENLTLTIDERVQYVAEQKLKAAVIDTHCTTGSVVAMDPSTGDILAMASYPTFDPNVPPAPGEDLASRTNLCVSTPFEPGSVFKVITLTAALETTQLRPETMVNCGSGVINLFGRIIHDHSRYASLSMADVLAKSSNIGAIQIGLKVGDARLLDYVQRFGFGRTTGIPLPGESAGLVRKLRYWSKSSIGSVAMGHEIMTTTVQLAQACSAVANGGLLLRPRLILKRQRPGGPLEDDAPAPPRRIMKPETAITMRAMMEGVVLHGTGTRARLAGYTSGGKTGTAQIFDFDTHKYTHKYNASFMGFAPVTSPAVVIVVTLNEASQYGGALAAPVFRDVATAALRVMDVPKDLPENAPPPNLQEVTEDDLAIAELAPAAADPAPAAPPAPPAPAPAFVPASYVGITGKTVPDFRGKTLRMVLEQAAAQGLRLEVAGRGIVREQTPAPGCVLSPGESVRVQFGR